LFDRDAVVRVLRVVGFGEEVTEDVTQFWFAVVVGLIFSEESHMIAEVNFEFSFVESYERVHFYDKAARAAVSGVCAATTGTVVVIVRSAVFVYQVDNVGTYGCFGVDG